MNSSMTRRTFALGSATLAGTLAASAASAPTSAEAVSEKAARAKRLAGVAPRNRHPYAGVDWAKSLLINTTSHGHCESEGMLAEYERRHFGLYTISNYYPSAPWCPAAKMRRNHYRVHHDFPVMVNGKRTSGPFDWNAIVSARAAQLPPKLQKELPFKEGSLVFPNFPKDVLEAPNAEHHNFKMRDGRGSPMLHLCAPGSAFASGTFDKRNFFGTFKPGGYDFGSGEFWGTAIDRMIDALIVPDGGGVTVNHPTWSKLDRFFLLELLDWDPRVLGIEVLENGRNSEHYWDWVLSTGRACYGFFVPDWAAAMKDKTNFGVNVLVVPERTVEACLRAYRRGDFYGAAHGLGELRFTSIAYDGKQVTASTDREAVFELITARGVLQRTTGTAMAWQVPEEGLYTGKGPKVEVFARIRATAADGCGEILYSQPFMLI